MVMVEMKDWFAKLILNMVLRMLVGKRYLPEDAEWVRFHKAMKTSIDLLGTFVVSDVAPYLRWLDLGGYEKVMRKTAKEMDDILELWLKEHKAKRNSGLVRGEQQDFMDAVLSHVDGARADDFPGFDADTISKSTSLAVLSGATDTTTVTLTWALSLLLNNRRALKKAQDELDIHVGRERQVEDSDIKNLVYLHAIIKETLRLYPAGPLGLPHEAMEDCVVGGYVVPKGTRLFVNLWKIHRDAQVWSDPSEFEPERFLSRQEDVDVRGKHFELIPFGSGRRMCPGMSFGLQSVQLTLASLIYGFEFVTPSNEPIDMCESVGLTNLKATPLEVLLSPRLSPNLYA